MVTYSGSFWDGLGVEFEAKYIFDFRGAPRGGPGVQAGRGDTGGPRTGGHGAAPGRGDTEPPPDGGTQGPPGRGNTGGPPRLFMGGT